MSCHNRAKSLQQLPHILLKSGTDPEHLYNRWFRVNVVHDVEGANVKVYIDRVLMYEAIGRGGTSHYFKCGVYAECDGSYLMESYWKGIKVLKKCN